MAQFQLLKGDRPVGRRFNADVDPYNTEACVDLLKRQAIGNKVPVEAAVLEAFIGRRKVASYRA